MVIHTNYVGGNYVGILIDIHAVVIRTGHHCAMPVAQFFGLPDIAWISLGVCNTFEEIDVMADALEKTIWVFP